MSCGLHTRLAVVCLWAYLVACERGGWLEGASGIGGRCGGRGSPAQGPGLGALRPLAGVRPSMLAGAGPMCSGLIK
jgi:hypothetical protein